jgi:hypothetical protein
VTTGTAVSVGSGVADRAGVGERLGVLVTVSPPPVGEGPGVRVDVGLTVWVGSGEPGGVSVGNGSWVGVGSSVRVGGGEVRLGDGPGVAVGAGVLGVAVAGMVRVGRTIEVGTVWPASNFGRAISAAIPRAYKISTARVITPKMLHPICWDCDREPNHRTSRLTDL